MATWRQGWKPARSAWKRARRHEGSQLARHFHMPRSRKFSIIVGTGVLCAVTAGSVAAAMRPMTPSVGNQVSMADLAIVTHAQSSSLSPAALGAQRAVELQAQQADGVQGFKDAVARRQHQIELAAIDATAARQAHLALLARAAAARQAAAQQAAAQRASSNSSSPSATVAQPVVSSAPSGSPQQAAQQMLDAAGQGGQFACLDSLWSRESGWNVSASNPGTGAYGIPQALPGAKMASAGADWQTDPATQIRWGLSYIDSLYGSPCGAWSHEEADGWY
jgi:hypothetical protein